MTSIPTRPTFAPWRILLRWYYQIRIAGAEDDIDDLLRWHQPSLAVISQIKLIENCIDQWRVLLANVQD